MTSSKHASFKCMVANVFVGLLSSTPPGMSWTCSPVVLSLFMAVQYIVHMRDMQTLKLCLGALCYQLWTWFFLSRLLAYITYCNTRGQRSPYMCQILQLLRLNFLLQFIIMHCHLSSKHYNAIGIETVLVKWYLAKAPEGMTTVPKWPITEYYEA